MRLFLISLLFRCNNSLGCLDELNKRPPPYNFPHPLTPQYYLAELATPSEMEVVVSQKDFEDAFNELTPSVSQEELAHYAAVQQQFTKTSSENNS